jgi:preprotein translocase subunit YajC
MTISNLAILLFMTAPQEGQSPFVSFLPLLLIIVVFYFFMIRPQMKKQKELKNFRDALKKGDKVVTTGGIYGRINDISGQVVTVDVGNNVHLKVDKNAVLKDPTDLAGQQ